MAKLSRFEAAMRLAARRISALRHLNTRDFQREAQLIMREELADIIVDAVLEAAEELAEDDPA